MVDAVCAGQRTIPEICFDKESRVIIVLERMPLPLKMRMELRVPTFHERLDVGSPLYQTLIKVNIVQLTVRSHTMAALCAFTGWDNPLSFQAWRLTGTYLFSFTPLPFFRRRKSVCGLLGSNLMRADTMCSVA